MLTLFVILFSILVGFSFVVAYLRCKHITLAKEAYSLSNVIEFINTNASYIDDDVMYYMEIASSNVNEVSTQGDILNHFVFHYRNAFLLSVAALLIWYSDLFKNYPYIISGAVAIVISYPLASMPIFAQNIKWVNTSLRTIRFQKRLLESSIQTKEE